jgi:hypothetical protein
MATINGPDIPVKANSEAIGNGKQAEQAVRFSAK